MESSQSFNCIFFFYWHSQQRHPKLSIFTSFFAHKSSSAQLGGPAFPNAVLWRPLVTGRPVTANQFSKCPVKTASASSTSHSCKTSLLSLLKQNKAKQNTLYRHKTIRQYATPCSLLKTHFKESNICLISPHGLKKQDSKVEKDLKK